MSHRWRAAIGIWRASETRSPRDRAYVVYAIIMVGLVAVAPVARAVWVSATSSPGLAVLASPAAPGVTGLVIAVLWACALLLGRDRGPALLPRFLTYVVTTSDLPRSRAFRTPLLRAGAWATAATTFIATLISASLMSHGVSDLLDTVTFIGVGVLVGVSTTVIWLAGQAFPRAAVPTALTVLAFAGVAAIVPVVQPFTPWGWGGLSYPGNHSLSAFVALIAATTLLVALVPFLVNRLGVVELAAQAARWESATIYAVGMDLSAATDTYRARPRVGRRLRAIRPGGTMARTFLIRDAIGASRTPGRLVVGVGALVFAGVLLTLAFAPATPGWLLGAAAGLIVFVGLGPLTDGIRHAASVASDLPLYGISDEHLLASHALFPLAVAVVVLLIAVIVCSIVFGVAVGAPLISALVVGVLGLMIRIGNALKGALPAALMAPLPTPMGDLGAVVRVAWAVDGIVLAAAAGGFASLTFSNPLPLGGTALAIAGVALIRWRRRT